MELRTALANMTVHELRIIARKLKIPGRTKLKTKEQLIEATLQCGESVVRRALNLTWRDRHGTMVLALSSVVGTLFSIAGVVLVFCGLPAGGLSEDLGSLLRRVEQVDRDLGRLLQEGEQTDIGEMRRTADELEGLLGAIETTFPISDMEPRQVRLLTGATETLERVESLDAEEREPSDTLCEVFLMSKTHPVEVTIDDRSYGTLQQDSLGTTIDLPEGEHHLAARKGKLQWKRTFNLNQPKLIVEIPVEAAFRER